jgi:hypothetical protein
MASGVDVRYPKREDFVMVRTDWGGGAGWERDRDCEAMVSNVATREKIEAILLRAFPGTEDRSDRQSDYHNCFWSVD